MFCPKCEAKSRCIDSRRLPDKSTTRRYKCLKASCRWRWSTTEMIVAEGTKAERKGGGRTGGISLREARDRLVLYELLVNLAKEIKPNGVTRR